MRKWMIVYKTREIISLWKLNIEAKNKKTLIVQAEEQAGDTTGDMSCLLFMLVLQQLSFNFPQ